jgi:hypothetical protein
MKRFLEANTSSWKLAISKTCRISGKVQITPKRSFWVIILAVAKLIPFCPAVFPPAAQTKEMAERPKGFAGSQSCRECHENFYALWASSMHAMTMQSFSGDFARTRLTPQSTDVTISNYRYRVTFQKRRRGDEGVGGCGQHEGMRTFMLPLPFQLRGNFVVETELQSKNKRRKIWKRQDGRFHLERLPVRIRQN